MARTIPQRVKSFIEKEKNPAKLYFKDMNEIYHSGDVFDIINTAFYYGYMRGLKSRRGGVAV